MKFNFPFFTINKDNSYFYDLVEFDKWFSAGRYMDIAQAHPILSPALLFVSKLFSQADIKLYKEGTDEVVTDSKISKLLKNPNFSQTINDLLEGLLFTHKANGVGVIYTKRNFLTQEVDSIYVLDYSLIKFPNSVKKNFLLNSSKGEAFLNKKVVYDENGKDLEIKLKDLMFFYDMPNVDNDNLFHAESLIKGLKQTLINTCDSLIAKNIILKTNGKELVTGEKDGFPLAPSEKRRIEKLFQVNYGLGKNRKRAVVTKANLTHKSLHIALRDLGLDESVKVDGNLIYTALHIPKDILSLEAKKTTYNNYKESMVSYIQNEIQTTLDSFLAVLNKNLVEEGTELRGTYEHLPVMQYILLEKYKARRLKAESLFWMRKAGLPDNVALREVGMDENIILNPIKDGTRETTGQGAES